MKSKTSFFSRTLFFNILRRFWPLFAAYPLVWLLTLPVNLNSNLSWAALNNMDVMEDAAMGILQQGAITGPIITGVFAVLFAMAAFSCFYNSRSVSSVCTLPVRREGLFLSLFLTGPVVMLVSNLLVAAVTMTVQGAYGAQAGGYVLQWLAMVTLQGLFFSGFAALCASLTGHILVLPVVYLVLNFTYFVVATLLRFVTALLVYGLPVSSTGLASILSPILCMLAYSGVSATYGDAFVEASYGLWGYIGVCAVIGVLFALLAMRLFRIRHMEVAGDVVAFRPLKPIFKYCLSFGCALVLGLGLFYLFMGSSGHALSYISGPTVLVVLALCMIFSSFVGYFSAEMLIHKTLRVFQPHRWKGFGAAALVVLSIILLLEFDVLGMERRIPDGDDVQSVTIYGSFDAVTIIEEDDPELVDEVLTLHRNAIETKYENEKLLSSGNDPFSKATYDISLTYRLKNGGSLTRNYNISEDLTEPLNSIADFFNSPEMILRRKYPGFEISRGSVYSAYLDIYNPESGSYESLDLEAEDAYHLYTLGIVPDMENGDIGLIWPWNTNLPIDGRNYDDTFMACTVNITFTRVIDGNINQSDFRTTISVDSANTLAILKEMGIEPVTYAQASSGSSSKNHELPLAQSVPIDAYA